MIVLEVGLIGATLLAKAITYHQAFKSAYII